MTGFEFRTVRLPVAGVHEAPMPDPVRREVWFVEPTDRAVVLGSTQRLGVLDFAEIGRRGLGVVRRHSGGGAVVVDASSLTWFDVFLPADDHRFERDVSASAVWLGEAVAEALGRFAIDATVLDAAAADRLGDRSWPAPLVCFADVAAGEVLVAGRKVVGISQRRTRAGARFQVMVLHRLDPGETAALFVLDPGDRDRLRGRLDRGVGEISVERAELRDALERALATR